MTKLGAAFLLSTGITLAGGPIVTSKYTQEYGQRHDVTFTVIKKDYILFQGQRKHLIKTQDDTGKVITYENSDSWFAHKKQAYTLQTQLEAGDACVLIIHM